MAGAESRVLLAMLPPQVTTVQEELRSAGIRSVSAPNLKGVRSVLAANPKPGLVLTQVSLPDGNWRDVMREVSRADRSIRVLLYTPAADAELWMDVLDSGVYDVIHSSREGAELREIVLAALGGSRP